MFNKCFTLTISLSLSLFLSLKIESMNYTTHIANQYVRSSPADTNPSVRTLISFNAGADWEPLRPPTSADSECIQVNYMYMYRSMSLLI